MNARPRANDLPLSALWDAAGPRRARALLAKPCSSFKASGGKDEYVAAVQAMQSALYQKPA
jgi:hypothetical protein